MTRWVGGAAQPASQPCPALALSRLPATLGALPAQTGCGPPLSMCAVCCYLACRPRRGVGHASMSGESWGRQLGCRPRAPCPLPARLPGGASLPMPSKQARDPRTCSPCRHAAAAPACLPASHPALPCLMQAGGAAPAGTAHGAGQHRELSGGSHHPRAAAAGAAGPPGAPAQPASHRPAGKPQRLCLFGSVIQGGGRTQRCRQGRHHNSSGHLPPCRPACLSSVTLNRLPASPSSTWPTGRLPACPLARR